MRKTILLLTLLCAVLLMNAQTRKRVSILGDSYSTYENFVQPDSNRLWYRMVDPRNDVVSVDQTWWHLFIKENGYLLDRNNSFSGATICNRGYDGADYTPRSYITRMDNVGCPDILFIFGGTNDSWAGVPMGEYKYSGWTQAELFTFRPALAKLLWYCTLRYPNTEIYVLLNNELSDDINGSMRIICKHYGVPLIELRNIDKQGGHPSIKGMRQICDQINAFINARKAQ